MNTFKLNILLILTLLSSCASAPKETPKEALNHFLFDVIREHNTSPSKNLDYEQYQMERNNLK